MLRWLIEVEFTAIFETYIAEVEEKASVARLRSCYLINLLLLLRDIRSGFCSIDEGLEINTCSDVLGSESEMMWRHQHGRCLNSNFYFLH